MPQQTDLSMEDKYNRWKSYSEKIQTFTTNKAKLLPEDLTELEEICENINNDIEKLKTTCEAKGILPEEGGYKKQVQDMRSKLRELNTLLFTLTIKTVNTPLNKELIKWTTKNGESLGRIEEMEKLENEADVELYKLGIEGDNEHKNLFQQAYNDINQDFQKQQLELLKARIPAQPRDYQAEIERHKRELEQIALSSEKLIQPENKKIKIVQFKKEDRKKLEQMMSKPSAKEVQQPVQQQVNKQLDIKSSIKEQNSKSSVIKQVIPEPLVTEVKQSVQQQVKLTHNETTLSMQNQLIRILAINDILKAHGVLVVQGNVQALKVVSGLCDKMGGEIKTLQVLYSKEENAVYSAGLDIIRQQLVKFNNVIEMIINKTPKNNPDVIILLQNKTNANIKALASIKTFAQPELELQQKQLAVINGLSKLNAKNKLSSSEKDVAINLLEAYIDSKPSLERWEIYANIINKKSTNDDAINKCVGLIMKAYPLFSVTSKFNALKERAIDGKEKAKAELETENNNKITQGEKRTTKMISS